MDSYQEFLNHFGIDKQALYEWGINATIFPAIEIVEKEWAALKERILTNQRVYIRGYGRNGRRTQLYKDLYKYLFGNDCVKEDPTNNAVPHRNIERLTGVKRNANIYNYQVSHIWGRTKNIFLFEAPWNICYVPKIIDPFTGHETKGSWPEEYQKIFLDKALDLYQPFVADYNKLLEELDVRKLINQYLADMREIIPIEDLVQFEKDVKSEFQPL